MAKRKTLKDTVPEDEIVDLGEIINEPNYPFPDGEYGITGGISDYSLVVKKIAYRTGTAEDGDNIGKVIRYENWVDYPSYHSDLVGIFKSYAKILNLSEFKKKKMKSDISELVNIHKNTYDIINTTLGDMVKPLSKEQESVALLLDMKQDLISEVNELRSSIKDLHELESEVTKELKKARKIVVDVNKTKKKE